MTANTELETFLKIKNQFKLGHLTTEKNHYLTKNLSELSKANLTSALERMKRVDELMLEKMLSYEKELIFLKNKVLKTISSGNKVFICGCGATGRLALTLETIFCREFPHLKNQIISFMAGGDYALVKSVESFEDSFEYAFRQLTDLGFSQNDLLIGASEGGETTFVIGATLYASQISQNKAVFIFCNEIELLHSIKRSHDILTNQNISSLSIPLGPMSISGSTRMQATSGMLLIIGLALLNFSDSDDSLIAIYKNYINSLKKISYQNLYPFIVKESQIYQDLGFINYIADESLAISIMTDTTERSPTFSLPAFETDNSHPISLSYLTVKNSKDSLHAWTSMLGRIPRGLDWQDIDKKLGVKEILEFNLSHDSVIRREKLGAVNFEIDLTDQDVSFSFMGTYQNFKLSINSRLYKHLLVKFLLNTHSTLVMGRMDRYYSNVMTYVRPSNYKLIDRSVRYIQTLLNQAGKYLSYDLIAKKVIIEKDKITPSEPIVLRVYQNLMNDKN